MRTYFTSLFSVILLISLVSCTSLQSRKDIESGDVYAVEIDDSELERKENVEIEFDRLAELERREEVKKEQTLVQKIVPQTKKQEVSAKSSSLKKKKASKFSLQYKKKHYNFWINYFTKRGPARFKRHLKNGDKVYNIVSKILTKHGLPTELFYVGLIESGFNTHIRSHASAVGPWQFIRGTATRYGLKVNSSLDERTNIFKATEAAAGYFKDLHNIFGSWELALCAYNAGEYRIINAIRKGNTRDYRELVRLKLLPKETIYYIPKVMAAKTLSDRTRHQRKMGDVNFDNASEVKAKGRLNLSSLARNLKVSYKVIKKLNPEFKTNTVPRYHRALSIYVPTQKRTLATRYIEKRKSKKVTYKAKRAIASIYRVKRGDNLSRIARKFKIKVGTLRKANRLSSSKIFKGQKLKIPQNNHMVYVVKSGDNLGVIARRFGTSTSRLVKFNRLKTKTIYPRQQIRIPRKG